MAMGGSRRRGGLGERGWIHGWREKKWEGKPIIHVHKLYTIKQIKS